jgi:thiazole synthase
MAGGSTPTTEETLMNDDPLVIAGRSFHSRLLVGTGKFPSAEALRVALLASNAEIVTVALRRTDLSKPAADSIRSVLPIGWRS